MSDKLLELEPNFTMQRFAQVYPFKKEIDRERYMEGLRLAGVPERVRLQGWRSGCGRCAYRGASASPVSLEASL